MGVLSGIRRWFAPTGNFSVRRVVSYLAVGVPVAPAYVRKGKGGVAHAHAVVHDPFGWVVILVCVVACPGMIVFAAIWTVLEFIVGVMMSMVS
jgi:hypothetical protein